jgi:peptide/nickel transport system ATP-binding protein
MKNLKTEFNTSMIMITHDLGVVAEICDKVAIMYAGNIIEYAEKRELFKSPKHPYTVGLFNSLPDIKKDVESLNPIKGLMPDPTDLPSGCPFHPRCDKVMPECSQKVPQNVDISANHTVRCLLYNK